MGAEELAAAVVTRWNDRNVRVCSVGDMQLTLLSER
jgi:hypothetical protein